MLSGADKTYYERSPTTHIDGTPIFRNKEDEENEAVVARQLALAWGCDINSFGRLAAVDWYAQRAGRLVGVLELKSRPHPHDRFATVFLNVRKWMALTLASLGLGVPALFVVRFDDGVWWVPITEIDANQNRMGGCVRMVKARSDVEPVIEVPVDKMRKLDESRDA